MHPTFFVPARARALITPRPGPTGRTQDELHSGERICRMSLPFCRCARRCAARMIGGNVTLQAGAEPVSCLPSSTPVQWQERRQGTPQCTIRAHPWLISPNRVPLLRRPLARAMTPTRRCGQPLRCRFTPVCLPSGLPGGRRRSLARASGPLHILRAQYGHRHQVRRPLAVTSATL